MSQWSSYQNTGVVKATTKSKPKWERKKIHTNNIILGPIDSGKFTATGHLIYKCGGSTKNRWKILEGSCWDRKRSFNDVWVLDKLKDEHEYCNIIDISLWNFETSKYHVTITDTSGYRDSQEHDYRYMSGWLCCSDCCCWYWWVWSRELQEDLCRLMNLMHVSPFRFWLTHWVWKN